MKRIVLWFTLVVFNALGVLLIHSAISHFVTAGASKSWPSVQGEVLSVEVVKEEVEDRDRKSGEPVTFVYYAEIKYRYSVDGANFEGDKLTVEDFATNDRQRAERIAMQYQAGQEVTVYYNPDAPGEALLSPGESGGALGTLIMGMVFMVVPTGMVLFIGGRDLFPRIVQLWWSVKFGKFSKLQDAGQMHPSEQQPVTEEIPSVTTLPEDAPAAQDFQEKILQWQPGRRVVLSIDPPNIWTLALGSGILAFLAALFGSVIIGMIFFEGVGFRGADERAGFLGIFALLFVLVGGYIFISSRWKSRGSRTIFDWDTNMLNAHREFSFSWQGSLHDIQSLIVRCVPTKGPTRRYRASIELDVVGKQFVAARTARVRRKPEKARAEALTLAEPLAAALGVPVHLEEWEHMITNI